MLVSFNKLNINHFKNKIICSENFDEVQEVVYDGIRDNLEPFVQTGKYGAINYENPTTFSYYVVKYTYVSFTLKEDITKDGQVSKEGEMDVKS